MWVVLLQAMGSLRCRDPFGISCYYYYYLIGGNLCTDVLGGVLGELSLSQFALLSLSLRLVLIICVVKQLRLTVSQ